jgi:transcriptional regulator with XRE-family HTH domain
MGQEVRGRAGAPALSADPERSIGAYLAQQRELRGISLDQLATLTRIPRRSLERLESGIFDRAPDGFVRGFVRTVASALGLDPDATVMRLLSEPAVDVDVERVGDGPGPGPNVRWLAFAVAALLAAGALAWLATGLEGRSTPPESQEVVVRQDPIQELAREAPVPPEAPAGIAAEPPADAAGAPAAPEPLDAAAGDEPAEPAGPAAPAAALPPPAAPDPAGLP